MFTFNQEFLVANGYMTMYAKIPQYLISTSSMIIIYLIIIILDVVEIKYYQTIVYNMSKVQILMLTEIIKH